VRAALAANRAFANTSLWLTTTRKWVTLSGCVHTQSQRRALVKFVAAQPMVERVFDEMRIGTRGAAPK
jgi:osmotically-inducible protein OsmY